MECFNSLLVKFKDTKKNLKSSRITLKLESSQMVDLSSRKWKVIRLQSNKNKNKIKIFKCASKSKGSSMIEQMAKK